MENFLLWLGRAAGLVGVLACLVAVAARITGHYWIHGVPSGTLLLGAMAAMLVACVCFLAFLTARPKETR